MLVQDVAMERPNRGSMGFSPDFVSVLEQIVFLAKHDWRLTPRERTVIRFLLEGRSNHAIGRELQCMRRTVELHVTNILAKAGAESRLALVSACWEKWILGRKE